MARKLGELLVDEGRISQGVLTRALQLQGAQARGLRLGAILLRWGLVPEKALLEALAHHHHCPSVDWATLSAATKEALNLLPPAQAIRLGAVPFAVDRKTVRVAFANPSNLAAIDEVAAVTRRRVLPSVISEVRLLQAQQLFYKRPLDRDIWTIVQKIERPAPEPPVLETDSTARTPEASAADDASDGSSQVAQAAEPAPIAAEPASFAPGVEDSGIEDLTEPAPVTFADAVRANTPGAPRTPALTAAGRDTEEFHSFLDGLPLAELLSDPLDPFADDTPLAEFIEQALSFYEAHPTFEIALASLDNGPIEDLGVAIEDERLVAEPGLDSTLPSSKARRRESRSELIL